MNATLPILAILLQLLAGSCRAQLVQTTLDEDGNIERLTAETEARLRVFPSYAGFREARMFILPDSSFLLEIEYLKDGLVARAQNPMTKEEGLRFRSDLSRNIAARSDGAGLDQEGRVKLIAGTTTLGIGFYSWAVPVSIQAEDGAAVGLGLLTAGLSTLYPIAWTSYSRVSDGMATLALQGGGRGIVDGFLLSVMFYDDAEFSTQTRFALLMSLGESVAGYNIARVNDLGGGEAAAIGSMGNFGLGIGLAASQVIDEDVDVLSRSGAAYGLCASALGYAAGAMLTHESRYTQGDADVLTTSGLLGAALPVAALYFARETETPAVMAAGIGGSIAGLVLGHLFLERRDFSSAQGNFVYLSTLSSGLVGAGLGYTFGPEQDGDRVVALTAAAGAAIGFGLMVAGISEEAEATWRSSAWRVSISPAGFAAACLPGTTSPGVPIPFLNISAHF